MTVTKRINDAVERAQDAFWSEIARAFPEAESGDFPPELTFEQDKSNRKMVMAWLSINAGLTVNKRGLVLSEVPEGAKEKATRVVADEIAKKRAMFHTLNNGSK